MKTWGFTVPPINFADCAMQSTVSECVARLGIVLLLSRNPVFCFACIRGLVTLPYARWFALVRALPQRSLLSMRHINVVQVRVTWRSRGFDAFSARLTERAATQLSATGKCGAIPIVAP